MLGLSLGLQGALVYSQNENIKRLTLESLLANQIYKLERYFQAEILDAKWNGISVCMQITLEVISN